MRDGRKHSKTGGHPQWMGRILLFVFIGLFLIFTGGVLALYVWINSYLRSGEFHKLVSDKTVSFLKAEGAYQPFHWNGFSIYSDGFGARGKPGTAFTELQANQIRAEFNPRGLLDRSWRIDQLTIQHLRIVFGQVPAPVGLQDSQSAIGNRQSAIPKSSWIPDKLDLRKIVVEETDLGWGTQKKDENEKVKTKGGVRQVRLVVVPDGNGWNLTGSNGWLYQEGRPELEIESFKTRFQYPRLFITDGRLKLDKTGILDVSGDIHFENSPRVDLQVRFSGIPVTPLLAPDWRARLKGNLQGETKVQGLPGHLGSIKASGFVKLTDGLLEALPVLDQIAAFTHTEQFRRLNLQKASADFSWEPPRLTVTRLILESEGLLCVEGGCTVENRMIDGQFQVGVTPSSLRWLPGAQSKVFTVERGGYLWTPIKLTGPVDHPKEDLSSRLMVAAGTEVIEGVKGVLEKGGAVEEKVKEALDVLSPLLK